MDPVISNDEALADPQLWNLYSYCRNNPVTFLDVEGKYGEKITRKMMLIRYESSSTGTHGYLIYEGVIFGHTLELPWRNNMEDISCIDGGEYSLSLHYRKDKHVWVVKLEDKNDRTLINIEIANEVSELKGCAALGKGLDPKTENILNSGEAVQQLVSFMEIISSLDFWQFDLYTHWVLQVTNPTPSSRRRSETPGGVVSWVWVILAYIN